jgi:hypothetical protein
MSAIPPNAEVISLSRGGVFLFGEFANDSGTSDLVWAFQLRGGLVGRDCGKVARKVLEADAGVELMD